MAVTLLSCECVEGLIPFDKFTQIYAAAYVLAGEDESLLTVECVAGLPPFDRLTQIYAALYLAAEDDSLLPPLCVASEIPFDRLTSIYAAAYSIAGDDTLPTVECVAALPPFDRLSAIYCALYAASSDDPVVVTTPWITEPGMGTDRDDFTGWVGCSFTVGADPLNVTEIGRIWRTGNSSSRDVGIFEADGTPVVISTVSLAAGVNGEFNYAAAIATLNALTTYTIASLEINGSGVTWGNAAAQTTTSVASITVAAFRAGVGTTGAFSPDAASMSFVPPNFKHIV